MNIDLKALKSQVDIVDIIGKYIELKKSGSEYKGICPWHDDSDASLNINERKQLWFCPVCEGNKKGDVYDFLQRMGHTLPESISILQGDLAIIPTEQDRGAGKEKCVKPVEWKHLRPKVECTDFAHYIHGQPNFIYTYRDINGIVGYVCRFEFIDGDKNRKETLPLIYATDGSRYEWRYTGFTNRPLYNSHLLSEYPKTDVILVEGEKVADWLNERLAGRAIAVTWIGGSGQVAKTDFEQLNGRKVLLWRDNDEPGKKCMQYAYNHIKSDTKYFAEVVKGAEKGDDAVDTGWNARRLAEFIRRGMRLPVLKKHNADETHFTYMGFEKAESQPVFILYGKASKTIFRLSAANITKSALNGLAPLQWWQDHYSGLDRAGVDAATNNIIYTSYKVGVYSPANVRGRGAWFDDGRVVIHAGDKLIVDGEDVALGELDTNYIYEIGSSFNFNTKSPLSAKEAKRLLDVTELLNWERGVNSVLLAGWCVIAPVCGALKWRSHIWLTGGAGYGKSWAFTNIVRRCAGETALDVQGATTEAGVRQSLQCDARPVIFDEVEGNDQKAQQRVQENIELARSASADDTGRIIKGSSSHTAKEFNIRSCFAFSSITVGTDKTSDRRRITTLSLAMPTDKAVRDERWARLQALYIDVVTDDYIERLHARTIMMLPVILENIKIFNAAIVKVLGTQAMGDQLAPMLAGAYSLKNDGLVTLESASKYVQAQDWADEVEGEALKDETELLQNLTQWKLKVDGWGERTIGELIARADEKHDVAADGEIGKQVAQATLKRSGMRVDDGMVMVSNVSHEIKYRLKDTRWSRNYSKTLKRLPGAEYGNMRFGGGAERCVLVPISVIFKE